MCICKRFYDLNKSGKEKRSEFIKDEEFKKNRINALKNKILDEPFDTQFIPIMVSTVIAVTSLYFSTTDSGSSFLIAGSSAFLAVVFGVILRYGCHKSILELELQELESDTGIPPKQLPRAAENDSDSIPHKEAELA